MASTLMISYLNGLPFYNVNEVQASQYRTKFMDDFQHIDKLYFWQDHKEYVYKWQTGEIMPFQFISDFAPLQLNLINRYGNTVVTQTASFIVPNKYQPPLSVFEFQFPFAGLPDGCYYLQLTNGNPAELNMVSPPIWVKPVHEDTVLFEYRNSTYHQDILFETGITLKMRADGGFDITRVGADVTSYENQKANPYILSARPFDIYPLVLGAEDGIPEWMVKKVNLIFTCNDVRIDGKSFAKSGEFTFRTFENYPLRGMAVDLREGINRGSKIVSPGLDPNKKLNVVYNIDSAFYGGLSSAGNQVISFTDVE